jgi:hypothetical protein
MGYALQVACNVCVFGGMFLNGLDPTFLICSIFVLGLLLAIFNVFQYFTILSSLKMLIGVY